MALRHRSAQSLRLLLSAYTHSTTQAAQLQTSSRALLHSWLLVDRTHEQSRGESRHSLPPPCAPWWTHLDGIRTLQTEAASKQQDKPSSKSLADAEQCDRVIESYDSLRSKYQRSSHLPPNIKTWDQRVKDVAVGLWGFLVATAKFTVSVPSRIKRMRNMTPEEWKEWRAGAWATVKHEAKHYWVGTKLLATDVKIASRLAVKSMRGKQLSRRERKQLTRTTADMLRMVPMVVILVVPFMELALPILLKLFPNMLPSTYEDKLKKEEEVKKRLAVKLEVARFLQDTVAEMARDINKKRTGEVSSTAADLYQFMTKVRAGGTVANTDILRFASLFNDELTLDNLDRVQLVSMCQFVGIAPFGTEHFLRSRLRQHLSKIKQDDFEIKQEGLEALTEDELRQACRARGMRAPFGEGAQVFMLNEMRDWLDLSLNRGLPSSLLLLSRAFTITAGIKDVSEKKQKQLESLKDTLSVLPDDVIQDVGFEACAEPSSEAAALQQKLELIKREEKLIKEEEQEQLAAAATLTAVAAPAVHAMAATAAADQSSSSSLASASSTSPPSASFAAPGAAPEHAGAATQAAAHAAAAAVMREAAAGTFLDVMDVAGASEEERAIKRATARQERMQHVISALSVLASNSGVAKERAMFMDLVRKEIDHLNETHAGSGSSPMLLFTSQGLRSTRPEDLPEGAEDAIPRRLSERVSNILHRIEKELDVADEQIGGKLHLLDLDNDGLVSHEELESAIKFLRDNLAEEDYKMLLEQLNVVDGQQHKISVEQLMSFADAAHGSSSSSSSSGTGAGGGDAASGSKDKVKIHTM